MTKVLRLLIIPVAALALLSCNPYPPEITAEIVSVTTQLSQPSGREGDVIFAVRNTGTVDFVNVEVWFVTDGPPWQADVDIVAALEGDPIGPGGTGAVVAHAVILSDVTTISVYQLVVDYGGEWDTTIPYPATYVY